MSCSKPVAIVLNDLHGLTIGKMFTFCMAASMALPSS